MATLLMHFITMWMTKCLEDLRWLWELKLCVISEDYQAKEMTLIGVMKYQKIKEKSYTC